MRALYWAIDGSDLETGSLKLDTELSEESQSKLKCVLKEFDKVFEPGLPSLPPKRDVAHSVELTDEKPVWKPQFRLSPKEKEALHEQTKVMLSKGLIRPAKSPYSAPVLFVKKNDGSLRMVIDYRALNKKTVKDRYPVPRINELVDDLGKLNYFSKMDLSGGFYQIRMHEGHEWKTAFTTPDGSFEFLVMPMGQCNSVSTLQRQMDRIFNNDEFRGFVKIYLDDILIHSKSEEEHLVHVRKVLEKLKETSFYIKPSKCEFGKKEILFVGQKVGHGKKAIDPEKSRAIREYPTPKNADAIRSFYGLVNFFTRIIIDISCFDRSDV